MASMCLWRNKEKVLKLHRLRRRTFRQPHTSALAEKEGDRVPHFHASEMDANA